MTPLVLDVDVVVSAHRNDHPGHAVVRPWLDRVIASTTPFAVPDLVWGSFLRLATNRKVFRTPTTIQQAFDFIDGLTSQPTYLPVAPGPRHLALVRELCDEGGATADLVPDAVLAAIATENGCAVATTDRDFARFPSVEHVLLRL